MSARLAALIALCFLALSAIAQTRMASDFEIAQMEKQLARERDFAAQLSARMNLGDLRATRNEIELARTEYRKAYDVASAERLDARTRGDLRWYALATAYAGLAEAKLEHAGPSLQLLEEAIRYAGDEAKIWNLYGSAMNVLERDAKAISASRNAVSIATRIAAADPTASNLLDLAIYQFTLATALTADRKNNEADREAERLLLAAIASLESPAFDKIRKDIARSESFEIYSVARGVAAGYISVLNRAQLRLAINYENRGDLAAARAWFGRVLKARSDDPVALSGLARLQETAKERTRFFVDAFDANPFSIALIRDYRDHLRNTPVRTDDGATVGNRVRRAIEETERGDHRAARKTIEDLTAAFPENDVLQYLAAWNDLALGDRDRALQRKIALPELRAEIAARAAGPDPVPSFLRDQTAPARPTGGELEGLIRLIAADRLTADQRSRLDRLTLRSSVIFEPGTQQDGTTIFAAGHIDGTPFRFQEPTAFRGKLAAGPHRLAYRILGVTERDGRNVLLLEPLGLEPVS